MKATQQISYCYGDCCLCCYVVFIWVANTMMDYYLICLIKQALIHAIQNVCL